MYKKFLIYLNWAFLRVFVKNLLSFLFNYVIPFVLINKIRKLSLEQKRDFWKNVCKNDILNIVFNDEIIVRRTINLRIKVSCNHSWPPMSDLFFEADFSTGPRVLYTKQWMFYVIGFENDKVLSRINSSIIWPFRRLTFNNEFN